jgi:hypothetical protein
MMEDFKTAKEIQKYILEKSGIKTSVKKGKGSMKGYTIIWPQFQNGKYPNIPFDLAKEIKYKLSSYDTITKPVFCSTNDISVFSLGNEEKIIFKKEKKPKETNTISKGWGSKNSQLRLDKAARRYSNNFKNGITGVRYN